LARSNEGTLTMARPPNHPGEVLADELAELEMSAAQLSRELHVPTNRVTQILAGKRGITADTALRLGTWFGTGPEIWMNLQKSYELRLAEQEVGSEIRNTIATRHAAGNAA
jgi:antitoxin HigA-1